MSIITYEDHFIYNGKEYYILDDICYCDGYSIYHSDYAYIRNHYEHYNLTVCSDSAKGVPEVKPKLYYLTYCNEYGIRLYETTSNKRRWVSSFPDNLKVYKTKQDAAKSIAYRHRYNDVTYHINELRR